MGQPTEKRCDSCGVTESKAPRGLILETFTYKRRWILFGRRVRVVVRTCMHCDFLL